MNFAKVKRDTLREKEAMIRETVKWNEMSKRINELEQRIKQCSNCSTCKVNKHDQKCSVDSNAVEYNMVGTAFKVDSLKAQVSISKDLDRFGRIQLLPRNIAEGKLENGEILTLIFDSGSSMSLISEMYVEK